MCLVTNKGRGSKGPGPIEARARGFCPPCPPPPPPLSLGLLVLVATRHQQTNVPRLPQRHMRERHPLPKGHPLTPHHQLHQPAGGGGVVARCRVKGHHVRAKRAREHNIGIPLSFCRQIRSDLSTNAFACI